MAEERGLTLGNEAAPPLVEPRFLTRDLTLPSPPLGLALVLEAAEDEDTSLNRLSWLINREPSLTTHLLRLSNSAAYSVGRPVRSITEATVYLGARTIRNMTLSHIVRTVSDGVDAGRFDTTSFWEHSLRRASAAHVLAEQAGYEDPAEAFTAGLIQDLGILVMAVQWPELAPHFQASMALPALQRRAREEALTGTTHDKLFAAVADEWGVPSEITRAIAQHHLDAISLKDRRTHRLAEILRLADSVADLTQVAAAPVVLARARARLDALKARRRITLERVTDLAAAEMRQMSKALEIRIRPQPSYEELVRKAHRVMAKVSDRYEEETQRLEQMLRAKEEEAQALSSRNAALARLASTDPLTGVPNRRAFLIALEEITRRGQTSGTETSVLMLDLDHFKQINDAHGHDAGDAVLVEVTRRFTRALRDEDVLGRVGGEEFAVVLPSCPAARGQLVAERLRIVLSVRPVILEDGTRLKVRVSVGGVVVHPSEAIHTERVLKRADQALYAAKAGGRNRVSWFRPAPTAR